MDSFTAQWSCEHVQPKDLAAAGFYYTGQIDRVRCFECGIEVCRWEEGDDPMSEHQRWGGRCRFLRKRACGNVPIGSSDVPIRPRRSRDVCGQYRLDYRPATCSQPARVASLPSVTANGSTVGLMSFPTENILTRLLTNLCLSEKDSPEKCTANLKSMLEEIMDEYRQMIDRHNKDLERVTERVEQSRRETADLSQQFNFVLCKICLNATVEVLFLPCAHIVACMVCALKLNDCPICRQAIKKHVRAYFA